MPALMGTGAVIYRSRGGIDAIDEYSRRLVAALSANGIDARYFPDGPSTLGESVKPSWILLQYNPFSFGRAGFAPGLVPEVVRLRRRTRAPLVVMVHEAWVDMTDPKSSIIGLWQRAQLRALLRAADAVMTSTQALAGEIGGGTVHVPVPANISPTAASREAAREHLGLDGRLTVALFGRANPSRALDHAEAAIRALARAHGRDRLAILNLGADAPPVHVPPAVEIHTPGQLDPEELSLRLQASDLVLLPFTDGVSTRRGTMMSALAHARPVLGLHGSSTDAALTDASDALVLTPVGDRDAYALAAVKLSGEPERLKTLGDAGRRLYESCFDWPVLARSVGEILARTCSDNTAPTVQPLLNGGSARRAPGSRRIISASRESREVVFVAHEVGGPGGMERVSEQLVLRLLDAGRPVTVVARSCTLGEHEFLRFRRVPTPRRPASLGYPAFFATASLLLARRGDALLHTTGAIVANRADVSTVHYCHHAAVAEVGGSRASRPSLAYRLNARVSGVVSLAGEAWCYRPQRTGLLCAVSIGVADELRRQFPSMAGAVRTVPNGVDSAIFRPDPAARSEVRAELGLGQDTALALFVGGDWGRKGLPHAVDALRFAPDWHLVVAGPGDPASIQARARTAGTADRLRLLGPVGDMARVYAAADAFVLPTTYEAFPLVVLEAAASGLPLLVTRVNGVEDLLEHGANGWFVSRDGRDIAHRMTQLATDPSLARTMAQSARAAAAGFSWEGMVRGYLTVYGELETRARV